MALIKFAEWVYKVLQLEAASVIDKTRPVLEELQERGYQFVTWRSEDSTCPICRDLHNKQWSLSEFIANLTHDAPMFEKSHPGDASCHLLVRGEGLPDVMLLPSGEATAL